MPTYRSRRYRRARFGPLTGRDLTAALIAGVVLAWFAHNSSATGTGPLSAAAAGGGGSAPSAGTARISTANANVALGKRLAAARGWGSGPQWSCLDALWTRESGWRMVWNTAGSGAYGIPQSLPADKMAAAGADYMTDPATQIKWGLGYIAATYGTPCNAWAHETANSWY